MRLGVKPCIHGYFTLESLDWLVAGGRVPKAAATITAALDTQPNLAYDLDGALTLTGVSRGRKKAIKTILKQFKENYEGDAAHPIAIVDADCPADGDAIEQMVRDELGDDCPRIIRLTLDPTIGAHVGPGIGGPLVLGHPPYLQHQARQAIARRPPQKGPPYDPIPAARRPDRREPPCRRRGPAPRPGRPAAT